MLTTRLHSENIGGNKEKIYLGKKEAKPSFVQATLLFPHSTAKIVPMLNFENF